MAVQRLGADTTSVDALTWDGESFGNAVADSMWSQLPQDLVQVAMAELQAGNLPVNILRNDKSGIVLLAFARPPMSSTPSPDVVRIHTSFALGNYCYDGTRCTYEDTRSGSFLAFEDREHLSAA